MKSFSELAQSVKFTGKGTKIRLDELDDELEIIGKGRSAYVFRVRGADQAIKVFFPTYQFLAKEEADIYSLLQGNDYYPKLYDTGHNYLVIDYISGNTLFECLVKGIQINDHHIKAVDKALMVAKEKGLNPSDIHLRNIMITTEGRIKLIDVARFHQVKHCSQWDDLKQAYHSFYRRLPNKYPEFVLNLIAFLYKKRFIPSVASAKYTSSSYSQRL
jgi:predicted Ser/Thr protein kinase